MSASVISKADARAAVLAQAYHWDVEDASGKGRGPDGGRRLHHCFTGPFGCDWDEADVLDVIDRADDQLVTVADTMLGKCLVVKIPGDGRTFVFDSARF